MDKLHQQHIFQALRASMSAGQVVHAHLFYGPAGTGKKTLAGAFAQALNCDRFPEGPCEICVSCCKTARRSHPDVHWIFPDGKALRIEQVRQVVKIACLKPREGRFQVFIFDATQAITPEAANSVLKTLEEPPPATVFILLAEKPGLLPPTVISRCQKFAMRRLAAPEMNGLPEGEKRGLPLSAEVAGFLIGLRQETGASSLATQLAGKDNLPAFLDVMLTMLRDLLVLQSLGEDAPLFFDRAVFNDLDKQWTISEAYAVIRILLRLQKDLQSPVSARLAAEAALRRIREVL